MFYARDILITNHFELAMRKASEVPNQKRSPITTSKHANRDLFLHNFGAAFAKRKIVDGRGFARGDCTNVGMIGAVVRRVSLCPLFCAGRLDSTSCSTTTLQVLNMIFRSSKSDRFFK